MQKMKKRGVASVIIFTLISCGIYSLYWVWQVMKAFDDEVGPGKLNAAVILILCLLTGPIGWTLFGYAANQSLNKLREKKGLPTVDNEILYIIIGLFIPIVLIGLVQNEVNGLAEDASV